MRLQVQGCRWALIGMQVQVQGCWWAPIGMQVQVQVQGCRWDGRGNAQNVGVARVFSSVE